MLTFGLHITLYFYGHPLTESSGMRKMEWKPRESKGIVLLSNKPDFKLKTVNRVDTSYFVMIKRSVHKKDTILDLGANMGASKTRVPKYKTNITRDGEGNRVK